VIKWHIDNALHLASTSFAAVLNIFPIFGPFFAPLKGQIAGNTDFWREAIFNLNYPLRVTHT
jgi:hypothetical protein